MDNLFRNFETMFRNKCFGSMNRPLPTSANFEISRLVERPSGETVPFINLTAIGILCPHLLLHMHGGDHYQFLEKVGFQIVAPPQIFKPKPLPIFEIYENKILISDPVSQTCRTPVKRVLGQNQPLCTYGGYPPGESDPVPSLLSCLS
jgi:hypothetical protein